MASSYENPKSIFEDFFRIKYAGSSNYRGSVFLLPEFTPSVCLLAFEFTLGVCLLACLPGVGGVNSWLNIIEFSEFSVCSVAKKNPCFQPKTLIPKHKNQIF